MHQLVPACGGGDAAVLIAPIFEEHGAPEDLAQDGAMYALRHVPQAGYCARSYLAQRPEGQVLRGQLMKDLLLALEEQEGGHVCLRSILDDG